MVELLAHHPSHRYERDLRKTLNTTGEYSELQSDKELLKLTTSNEKSVLLLCLLVGLQNSTWFSG